MFLLATTVTGNTISITNGAVKAGGDIMRYFSVINWAAPTWDIFIVLFFVITVFLYGMSLGRDRIIVILISIYMALAVISNAPFLQKLNNSISIEQFFAFKVAAFLGLFVLIFFLLSHSALAKTFGNLASGTWLQVFIFSIFHVGLLVSITISFLPPDAITHLAPITQRIFGSEYGRFFWTVAPIVGMTVLKG